MKKNIFNEAVLAVFLMVFVVSYSYAQTTPPDVSNEAQITQVGADNGLQNNISQVTQVGDENKAIVDQWGVNGEKGPNSAIINQGTNTDYLGATENNTASVYQMYGTQYNSYDADIERWGPSTGNQSTITQDGTYNNATAILLGEKGGISSQSQTGNGNDAIAWQGLGDMNQVVQTQTGNNNNAISDQHGTMNVVTQIQVGDRNEAIAYQNHPQPDGEERNTIMQTQTSPSDNGDFVPNVGFTVSNYAYADQRDGDDNDIISNQNGSDNTVYQFQKGDWNEAEVRQVGDRNEAYQYQGYGTRSSGYRWNRGSRSDYADAEIIQENGNDNVAEQFQWGGNAQSFNDATVDQSNGDDNYSLQIQKGIDGGNVVSATQSGDQNWSLQVQHGNGNDASVTQTSNKNYAEQRQGYWYSSPKNRTERGQRGYNRGGVGSGLGLPGNSNSSNTFDNDATVTQEGGDMNESYQGQVGLGGHQSHVLQNGSMNFSETFQSGMNNLTNVNQTGNGNSSTVIQSNGGVN